MRYGALLRLSPLALALSLSAAACGGGDGANNANPDAGPTGCTADTDCTGGQVCDPEAMICVDPSTGACATDEECGDGRTCDTDQDPAACVAASCTDHPDCGSWVCVNALCIEPPSCETDPCPGNLVCNEQDVCAPPQACADDTECAGDEVCAGGVCRAPVICATSAECPVGLVCQLGVCDDPCADDDACGDPLMFTCDAAEGVCRQRCLSDDNCDAGTICEANVCVDAECASDNDCRAGDQECQGEEDGHGRCVDVFACMDDGDCPDNFRCDNMTCVELPPCRNDRECTGDAYCEDRHCQPSETCTPGSCAEAGFECVGGLCVPEVCRGAGDCPNMGEVCVGGACVPEPSAATVAEVRMLTPAGTVLVGQTYRFTAVALNGNGAVVPGVTITFASSDTAAATIDAAGLATAGSAPGTTEITAVVDNGAMTVASAPVALRVLDASANALRVTVVARADGAPVSGATVDCDGQTATTAADGTATFPNMGAQTCSVFSDAHDYLTVVGLTGTEALFALPPLSRTDRSTGYTGTVDTSAITSAVRLSFSGGSFGSPLFGMQPANILGGDVFNFEVPVIGNVAFPSGATASAEFMGFPLDLKGTYASQTEPGLRRSWTFAGGAEIEDLGLTGGGNLLSNVLPLMQTFVHGTNPGLDTLAGLPVVVDSGDVDGDGDTTEMVPDYDAFVPVNHTPQQAQRLRVVIDGAAATLPANTNSVLVVSGVLMPRVGFVPLGLDGISEPGGALGRFSTTLAPAYAGLEAGEYAVLVAAVNIQAGSLPQVASARMVLGANLTETVDLSAGFLELPMSTYDDGTRALDVGAATGATVWRARFSTPAGGWHVYGEAGATQLTLPTPPMGVADRAADAGLAVEIVELEAGDLNALFVPNGDALAVDRATARFAQSRVR